MYISKVKIKNFKCFKDTFTLNLNEGLNILVGNNEAGKSTILEAIRLALTGLMNGKYLKNELSQYLFNNEAIQEYLATLATPPEILIEVFIAGTDLPFFEGDGSSEKKKECGLCLRIGLDEKEQDLYEEYIKSGEITALPLEYYDVTWTTCARESITPKRIPIKSALIDSSSNRYQNGSDIYISHILRNHLTEAQKIAVSQAHRKMQGDFMNNEAIKTINNSIEQLSKKTEKDKLVKLSVDLSSKNAWENSLMAYVEDVPFHNIGKGEQAIVKTKLALEHKKAKEANIILLEEPENHLSHSKLNQLIRDIKSKCHEKQIIISTHSSFVANKLGLSSLILLNNKEQIRLRDLSSETINFFEKISGYDTLRLMLCESAILCEGDSDELLIQKAYMNGNSNHHLPIEDNIDVISVGLSFMRYVEIAEKLKKRIAIVTDNDGGVSALEEKWKEYNSESNSEIKVFFDNDPHCTTLEPQLIKVNDWKKVNEIIDQKYKQNGSGYKKGEDKCKNETELLKFMSANKTECALKFFETSLDFNIPQYISDAIKHAKRE